MALTEEEKRRIEEEEEYRASIRGSLNNEGKPKKKKVGIKKVVIFFLLLALGIYALNSFLSSISIDSLSPEERAKIEQQELKKQVDQQMIGEANFDGSQFIVINQENKDWEDCHFQLNDEYHYPGNSIRSKLEVIKAGETIGIQSGQLVLEDNTRFNPFAVKPQKLSVICKGDRIAIWNW